MAAPNSIQKIDVTICSSGDTGDGCGGSFGMKISPGLCGKCTLLAGVENDNQHATILAWKQCPCCGRAWKNFNPTNDHGLCGGCEKSVAMPPPPVPIRAGAPGSKPGEQPAQNAQDIADAAVSGARNARSHAMDCRINKQPNQDVPLKTSPLDPAANTTDGSIFLLFEARIRRTEKTTKTPPTEGDIGKWGKSYARTTYMSDVLESEILEGNIKQYWDKREGMSLLPEEGQLRWQGNLSLPPGSDSMTLGEFARLCTHGEYSAMFGATVSKESRKHASGNKPLVRIPLEIYIDKVSFDERKQRLGYGMRTAASRKRSGTESNSRGFDKRQASESSSGQLTFVRSIPRQAVRAKTEIVELVRATSATSDGTGEVAITWPRGAETESGVLTVEHFAKGATKNVHQLVLGTELYVAKRFFDTGKEGSEPPNAIENGENLELELMRLENLRWFLNNFFRRARQRGVEHDSNIAVANAFLVRETGEPSEASGFDGGGYGEVVWLVEPRRPQAVRKFCGTLAHPSAKDKTAITISALLHYVFDKAGGGLAFADVQGSKTTIQGTETLVLFDPMTHTPDGESGVGDHGDEGIDKFIAQHQCTYVCQGLGLEPLSDAGAFVGEEEE